MFKRLTSRNIEEGCQIAPSSSRSSPIYGRLAGVARPRRLPPRRNRVANPTHSLYVIKPRTRVAARGAGGWHAWNSRTSRRILPPAAMVCARVCVWLFYRGGGGRTRRFVGDARPWQPSRESCHVESSPGDMTAAFYG